MPECKWCLHFNVEHKGYGKHLDTEFSCKIGKLNAPTPDDSCEAWELHQEMVDEMERDHQDMLDEQEQLRRGQF